MPDDSFPFTPDSTRQSINDCCASILKHYQHQPQPFELSDMAKQKLKEAVYEEIERRNLSRLSILDKALILQAVLDEIFHFGPISPLIRDLSIIEIFIYSEKRINIRSLKVGECEAKTTFRDIEHLMRIIERLIYPKRVGTDRHYENKLGSEVYVHINLDALPSQPIVKLCRIPDQNFDDGSETAPIPVHPPKIPPSHSAEAHLSNE